MFIICNSEDCCRLRIFSLGSCCEDAARKTALEQLDPCRNLLPILYIHLMILYYILVRYWHGPFRRIASVCQTFKALIRAWKF